MPLNTSWYEYATNYTNDTVDSFGKFVFKYPNFVLNNQLGMGIIILLFLVVFVASLVAGSRKALMTAGFISFIFSIFLVRLDLIHPIVVVVLLILTIIGAIGSSQEKSF